MAALLAATTALALVLAVLPAPASAAATSLTVLIGSVSVTRGGVPSTVGPSTELVNAGDEIRAGADAHAILSFVDGSTMTIEPDTTVVIEEASLRQGSAAVRILQSVGRTWSSVSRILAPGSRYEVRTPAVTASVRGTAFEVSVASDGTTSVRSADGSVAVSNALGETVVGPGAETTATPTTAPAPAAPAPPTPRRVLEVGSAPILVYDAAGRACGLHAGRVVQQIPGCVVRDGVIELWEPGGPERQLTLSGAGPDERIVERVIAADGTVAATRELTVSSTGATQQVVPLPTTTARPTIEVTLPFIGTVPVQVDLSTPAPTFVIVTAAPLATVTPVAPIATLVPVATPTLATVVPLRTPTPTPLPTLPPAPTAAPIVTAAPVVPIEPVTPVIPIPSVGTPDLQVATPAPTPTPAPTATPTATPTPAALPSIPSLVPTLSPTPTPCPSPLIGGVCPP